MSEEIINPDTHKQPHIHCHQSIPIKKRRRKKTRSFGDTITIIFVSVITTTFLFLAIFSIFFSTKYHAINEREHESYNICNIFKSKTYPHNFNMGVCVDCGYRKKDDGFTEAQKDQLQDMLNKTILAVDESNKKLDSYHYLIESNPDEDSMFYLPIGNDMHMKILKAYGTDKEHYYYIEDCVYEDNKCKFCGKEKEEKEILQ